MKRLLLILTAATVLALAAIWWWQAGVVRSTVMAALPDSANLTGITDALRDRLTSAEANARSRFKARDGLRELSRLYHANGYLAEAEACYRALMQLDPREGRWPHLLATILAGYGDMAPALELWRQARQLAPDYLPIWLRSGDAYLKSNQAEEAAAAYTAALRLEADNPYALLGLARLDMEAGRLEQARQRLEQVVRKTNYVLGYDLIVSLYERLGQQQQAASIRAMAKASGAYRDPADPWLDSLIEDCLDPYRLSLAAGTVARNGDSASALRLLQRALSVAPNDVSVLFQLGTFLIQQGDYAGAIQHLRRCTELAPDFADGWANLSALQAMLGETAAAARTLEQGLRNCPNSPGLHLQYARDLQKAGRYAEAAQEFQTSIRLRPNEPDAYIELGYLFIRQGRNAEAVQQMERALQAEPGHPAALGVLAMNAIMSGDETEARRRLAAAREQPRMPREQMQSLINAYRDKFGRAP